MLACCTLLAASGCASAPPQAGPTTAVELTAVPFFPQTVHQCGPAALATILTNAGVATDPAALTSEVYVAGLRGSLQAELLGATRRHGLIPYVLTPDWGALTAELAAGRPVLVLESFGLRRVPMWHYAVVVGVDPQRDRVILRSGRKRRRIEHRARFLRRWAPGHQWAFVAITPGELPASATPALYVRALAGAEPLLPAPRAAAAFAAALTRWPNDELVLFAAAGHALASHDLSDSAALYRRLLAIAPRNAAARNNLANVLAEQGCRDAALAEARAALALVAPTDRLYDSIRDTVATIERARQTPATAAGCS